MYIMAALEPNRYSFQVIHEHDPCCFHGYGRHGRIIKYNQDVQSQTEGHFETTPTVGNVHEVNYRDKTVNRNRNRNRNRNPNRNPVGDHRDVPR
jgi:hypothetical protein